MIFASHKQSGLVAEQCVLIATKETRVINNKDVSTLNVTKCWKIFAIEKQHCLGSEWSE